MAVYINNSRGLLIAPDGTEYAHGAEINVTKDLAENAGVSVWIEEGRIVKRGDYQPDPDANADLAAEKAKVSDLEAQVAALQKDLEAATKPAK